MPWIKLRGQSDEPSSTVLINLERVLCISSLQDGSTIFMATDGRPAGFFEVKVKESSKDIERVITTAGGGPIGGA